MKQADITDHLSRLRKAREAWGKGRTEFFAAYDVSLTRLIHEAVANRMGAAQVAEALGVGPSTIRTKMRSLGYDPRAGKRLLNQMAAEALANNSALLDIDPSEMDLMSPLAYLPMGSALKDELRNARALQTQVDPEEVSGNTEAELRAAKGLGWDRAHTMLCQDLYPQCQHRNPWALVRA